ncbi:hypothetical protein KI387_022644 [Taxus chinensis]|uniref:Uncharacterized protein n=1 Tax=Taxus chinensis TaxID=29808 RepID=A0AA38LAV3_TAXCH|nr:hypothetical protein KI387_022644 [Taxus chinensis]
MFRRKGEKDNAKVSSEELVLPKSGILPVVSSQFCTPNEKLVFSVQKRPNRSCSGGDLIINDAESYPFARVEGRQCRLQEKRILRNASGKPLLTLKRKVLSINYEWDVYLGEKTDPAKLLFRARTSFPLQLKTPVNVYMAYNTDEEQWDFKVKGDYVERASVFYYGARTIAQLSRKRSATNELLGRDTFLIKIEPGVDYVFVMALVVILDEINRHTNTE